MKGPLVIIASKQTISLLHNGMKLISVPTMRFRVFVPINFQDVDVSLPKSIVDLVTVKMGEIECK